MLCILYHAKPYTQSKQATDSSMKELLLFGARLYGPTRNFLQNRNQNVRSEVFAAVTMKNAVFWDVAQCRSCVNRRFGGTPPAHAGSSLAHFSTLKMEAISSSETSVHTRPTQRHIPEDGTLQKLESLRLE
jgi:hypothetical protein